jgi:phosphopantetheine--protein transferase-like protein
MIGVDLVYIPEFQARLDAGGITLLEKMFTLTELKNRRTDHLAGIWAAKEAVRKILPDAPKAWTDIFLTYDGKGKPSAHYEQALYDISISHQGEYAIAVALINNEEKRL